MAIKALVAGIQYDPYSLQRASHLPCLWGCQMCSQSKPHPGGTKGLSPNFRCKETKRELSIPHPLKSYGKAYVYVIPYRVNHSHRKFMSTIGVANVQPHPLCCLNAASLLISKLTPLGPANPYSTLSLWADCSKGWHIRGPTQYLSPYDGCMSLSTVSRFIHRGACAWVSFLPKKLKTFHGIGHFVCLLSQPFLGTWVGYWELCCWENGDKYLFETLLSIFLDIYPETWLIGQMTILGLISFFFFCICVFGCMCKRTYVHVDVHMWQTPPIIFETLFYWPGAHQVGQVDWTVSPGDLLVFASLHQD
jgi:hypothetical protein